MILISCFVRQDLSDDEIERVILYEIGHAKNDAEIVGDYKCIGPTHTSSEYRANDFLWFMKRLNNM